MAVDGGSIEAARSTGPDMVAQAHQALLGQRDLQFDFLPFTPQPPPAWLKPLIELFEALGPVFKVVFWVGAALGLATIVYFVVRELLGVRLGWRRKSPRRPAASGDWRPSAAQARSLLEDADRLAGEGRFDEAAHLLLFRSIEDIDGRWPGLIRPALTSRDIAGLGGLPQAARATFASIARVVERSLFGGQALTQADFADCRRAYQAFALPVGA